MIITISLSLPLYCHYHYITIAIILSLPLYYHYHYIIITIMVTRKNIVRAGNLYHRPEGGGHWLAA